MDTDISRNKKIDKICYRNILIPIDGSIQSFRAAYHAAYLAELDKNISLTLLYVVDVNKEISSFEQVSLSGYVPSELKEAGYRIIDRLKSKLIDNTANNITAEKIKIIVKVGIPANVIVDIAKDDAFDCIVMGSRGLGKLKSIFLGSVSQYVLQYAHCPVLIIH